jgi:hypothetical protein
MVHSEHFKSIISGSCAASFDKQMFWEETHPGKNGAAVRV